MDTLDIREAYERAFTIPGDSTTGRPSKPAVWDDKVPPTAVELAAMRAEVSTPAERGMKLKEYAHLGEQQVFGPGGVVIDIEKDWEFQRLCARIRPKLKEMTLSDQAFAGCGSKPHRLGSPEA